MPPRQTAASQLPIIIPTTKTRRLCADSRRRRQIELKYVTMAHLELTSNSYWLLDGVNSDKDQPRAIYPLNPGNVRVKLNKTQFPYKRGGWGNSDRSIGGNSA
jgi:hypothetical protein